MKQKLIAILLGALSLLAVTQVEANTGVERTANTWLLTPASWHPNPSKTHENYPFDLQETKINMGDGEPFHPYNNDDARHPMTDKSVSAPIYHQKSE
jgi:hypothetical protein